MPKTFHELVDEARENVTECNVLDVIDMLNNKEDFVLVDIREDNEHSEGKIKGAIHISKGILERDIHLHIPDHNKKIVLYCRGGYRSILASESLQKMGYTNVLSMHGGWKNWKVLGGEVEK